MHQHKGFALLQALFFMMFIMAVVSVTMMMSSQRSVQAEGERLATDAYPALHSFLTAVNNGQTDVSGNPYTNGMQYFKDYPLSPTYVSQLTAEGFSDPAGGTSSNPNLAITLSQ